MTEVFVLARWDHIVAGIVLLLVSFVLSNVIVLYMQKKRTDRIEEKVEILWKSESATTTPITLITGFLGSGKTTLLNYILTSPDHGLKIAVIENEFGEISIDHALIKEGEEGRPADGVLVMKNGCMCCSGESPGTELERVLDKLIGIMQFSTFDYVLVETTGLADPAPIIETLFRYNMRSQRRFSLDGVVCMVDALNIQRHLEGNGFRALVNEAESQIAFADVIMLNKTDLVEKDALVDVTARIRSVNGTATIRQSHFSQIEGLDGAGALSALLHLHAFSVEQLGNSSSAAAKLARTVLQSDSGDLDTRGNTRGGSGGDSNGDSGRYVHGRAGGDRTKARSDGVGSISICYTDISHGGAQEGGLADVNLQLFQAWVSKLVQDHWEKLFRLKGVLAIAGSDRKFIVHAVHTDVQAAFGDEWCAGSGTEGSERSTQLVLIGKGLLGMEEEIRRGFAQTLSNSNGGGGGGDPGDGGGKDGRGSADGPRFTSEPTKRRRRRAPARGGSAPAVN
jgi:G3E family GTPase